MKITSTTKAMLSAVAVASKVINPKSALPICECVKLWESNGDWWLTGGDTEKQVTVAAPVVEASGDKEAVCIGATKLLQTLGALADAPMTMETKDGNVIIKAGKGKYKMPYDSADEYPSVAAVGNDERTEVVMPGSVFVANVKAGLAARSEDELRPVLGGVALDVRDSSCTFASSDGHRLYTYMTAVNKTGADCVIVIPSAVAKSIDSMFKAAGEVHIVTDGRRIQIWSDGISLIAPVVEGKYPNYKSVIPDTSTSMKITCNVKEMMSALNRCSIFASDASHLVAIEVKDGHVELVSEDIDFSRGATEELTVVSTDARNGFKIGANIPHLLGLLKNVSTENATLLVSDAKRPIIIKEDSDDSGMLELLMPCVV